MLEVFLCDIDSLRFEFDGGVQETVKNVRKSEIKGKVPGRIERGLVRVDGGEVTDFWRVRWRVWG